MLRRIGIAGTALLMVVGTADLYAQGRQGGFGGGGGRTFASLLRVEEVQVELEMTEGQKEELSDVLTVERSRGFGGFGGQRGEDGEGGQRRRGQGEDGERRQRPERDDNEVLFQDAEEEQPEGRRQGFQDLSDEERAQRREEAAQRERETEDKIAEVLQDAQLARLVGIYIQVNGTGALAHRWVAERLELSGRQEEQIATARSESQENLRTQMREAFQEGGDREAAFARIGELREQADEEVMMVLSGAQRERLEQLKGAEFDMPQSRGFGGFGGGQGGQGGRPGAGDGNRPQRPQRPGGDDSV